MTTGINSHTVRLKLIIGQTRTDIYAMDIWMSDVVRFIIPELALDLISDNFVTPSDRDVHGVFCAKQRVVRKEKIPRTTKDFRV